MGELLVWLVPALLALIVALLLWLLWKRGYIGACPNHVGELP